MTTLSNKIKQAITLTMLLPLTFLGTVKSEETSYAFEYKARHILLETEKEALSIVEELNNGADFEELAKEKSTGPSGPTGGDLGWFEADEMVEPFSKAVQEMEINTYTKKPVKSDFGWHIIRLDNKKEINRGTTIDTEETQHIPASTPDETQKPSTRKTSLNKKSTQYTTSFKQTICFSKARNELIISSLDSRNSDRYEKLKSTPTCELPAIATSATLGDQITLCGGACQGRNLIEMTNDGWELIQIIGGLDGGFGVAFKKK